jgi:arylsulfatase
VEVVFEVEKIALGVQDWGRLATPGNAGRLGRLFINGKPVGEARFRSFGSLGWETMDIGSDTGTPVSDAYSVPFVFNGQIEKVTLELQ